MIYGCKFLLLGLASALLLNLLGPGAALARSDWFIDPARNHISAHGQMSCVECHDDVADQDDHPDPSRVTMSARQGFQVDRCAMCHDQVMEDLEKGAHGRKSKVNPEFYQNCVFCHDPHYVFRQGANRTAEFKPGVPEWTQCSACHEDREALPPPAEDDLECLKCHQPGREAEQAPDPDLTPAQVQSFICTECHLNPEPDTRAWTPLIDPEAYAQAFHAQESCLSCHPGAAGYEHNRQKPGVCLSCHAPHDEAKAHEAHFMVTCQACHLPEVRPVRDFATKKIGWELEKRPQDQPLKIHEFILSDDEDSCRRCHFSGNQVGAAALVLPAKSVICMPCHTATLSVGDATTIISLLIFLVGAVGAVLFWFSGTLEGPGSKLGRVVSGIFSTIFSARILAVIKAVVLDGLIQRRLYRHSPSRWAVHALIFWPFALRFCWGLIGLILSLAWPESALARIMVDKNHPATAMFFDLSGITILIGAGAAMVRRMLSSHKEGISDLPSQDRLALALLGGIVMIGFLVEGMRIAMTAAPGGAHYAFIGYGLSLFLTGMKGLTEVYGYLWYAHAILTGAFVAYLPFSRMFHILTGPLALAVKAARKDEHHGPDNPGREE